MRGDQGAVWARGAGRPDAGFVRSDGAMLPPACALNFSQRLVESGTGEYSMVGSRGFLPEDIMQGSVGDCWFLAALAVVAERGSALLRQNVLTTAISSRGHYQFRLFIDGAWQVIDVDDHLPVRTPGSKVPGATKVRAAGGSILPWESPRRENRKGTGGGGRDARGAY